MSSLSEPGVNVSRETKATNLPSRYQGWAEMFDNRVASELRPGISILDVGGGRRPAVPVEQRPEDCLYAGLDLAASELAAAPDGSYSESYVGDIANFRDDLADRFDLIVSWQVLEHVKSLDASIENVRRYLKPGGRFISQFSGTFSSFGLINQLVPASFGVWLLKHLKGRDPATVFPAYYHHCWYNAVRSSMSAWSGVEVVPRYKAADYLRFFRPLQKAYLVYENWTANGRHPNLATHYLVDSRR
ncbi:MAG: methyltransferase domain-containing protein [Dehalococcoidia bacterium]|nr:methyltransferase domain-containing protein [Dehalococcoidia bacterium]